MSNKYGAKRVYSELCGRFFASKAECKRGEDLRLLEMDNKITDLEYQPRYVLCKKPRITYTADFRYYEDGQKIIEDVKGMLTRDARTKIAWLKDKFGIEVTIVR